MKYSIVRNERGQIIRCGKGKNHPKFGKKHTDEFKKNISLRWKKFYLNNPSRKKEISFRTKKWWKDNPQWKGKNHPLYGKNLSEEHKKKISETRRKMFKNGELKIWTKGKCRSEKTRKLISERLKEFYKKNPDLCERISKYKIMFLKKHPDYYKGKNHPLYGMIGEKSPNYGRKNTMKTKKNMSKIRIEYYRHNNPSYPKAYFVKKLGHKVRSAWEEEIGLLMKNNNIKYEYEPDRIDLGDAVYIPDFRLNQKLYVEVKGWLQPRNKKNLLKMRKLYPDKKVIGVGDGSRRYFHEHLKWKDRNELPHILKEMLNRANSI
jgi:hypothetical protein